MYVRMYVYKYACVYVCTYIMCGIYVIHVYLQYVSECMYVIINVSITVFMYLCVLYMYVLCIYVCVCIYVPVGKQLLSEIRAKSLFPQFTFQTHTGSHQNMKETQDFNSLCELSATKDDVKRKIFLKVNCIYNSPHSILLCREKLN